MLRIKSSAAHAATPIPVWHNPTHKGKIEMTSNAITFTAAPRLFAYSAKTGRQVHVGDTVTSFRGEIATVAKLSSACVPGKSGKVVVHWTDGNRCGTSEYYDGVFDLVVTDVAPGRYDVYTLDGQGEGHLVKRNVKAHKVIGTMVAAMLERNHWNGDWFPSK